MKSWLKKTWIKNLDWKKWWNKKFLIEEVNQNELMSKKHERVCKVLNYIEHLLIVISTITGCASISSFASLVRTPIGTASSTIGLKI